MVKFIGNLTHPQKSLWYEILNLWTNIKCGVYNSLQLKNPWLLRKKSILFQKIHMFFTGKNTSGKKPTSSSSQSRRHSASGHMAGSSLHRWRPLRCTACFSSSRCGAPRPPGPRRSRRSERCVTSRSGGAPMGPMGVQWPGTCTRNGRHVQMMFMGSWMGWMRVGDGFSVTFLLFMGSNDGNWWEHSMRMSWKYQGIL